MIATRGYRGPARTTVHVVDIVETDTDDQLVEAALQAANETKSSLFGIKVHRGDDVETAVVHLYTD